MEQIPLIRMRGISKVFPENGVTANHLVDFDILPGEIHSLIGENGSGKSTLMHILSGMIHPDSGHIETGTSRKTFRSPHDAILSGIGMVHQQVQIIREFSVLENIILGQEEKDRWGRIDWSRTSRRVMHLMKKYGLHLDLDRKAYNLSIDGMQKLVLLSLLYAGVQVIILDEPMSLFEDNEGDLLQTVLRRLKEEGHSLVLITHKLKEALLYSDRISVMHAGMCVGTFRSSSVDREVLSRLMINGRSDGDSPDAMDKSAEEKPAGTMKSESRVIRDGPDLKTGSEKAASSPLLRLSGVSCSAGLLPRITDVSFQLRQGEILAITGIRENGLETLEQILTGFAVPETGDIRFKGERINGFSIRELRKRKIAYIPTERMVRGASLGSSVEENMIVLNYKDFHSWGLLKKEEIEHFSKTLKRQYNIKASAGDTLSRLSGGNIQKVIIARELQTLPDLLIFSEPSWGLDFSGRRYIQEQMNKMKETGAAVLVITSDIEEALECSDRIIVMYRGRVNADLSSRDLTKNDIGRIMLGVNHGS